MRRFMRYVYKNKLDLIGNYTNAATIGAVHALLVKFNIIFTKTNSCAPAEILQICAPLNKYFYAFRALNIQLNKRNCRAVFFFLMFAAHDL